MRDYDETCASFEWERPDRYNFARDVIDARAQTDPDAQALLCVSEDGAEEHVSYAEISAASRRVANVLSAAGVRRGDVVILVLGRDRAWWEAMTACIRMGAIASPGTSQLSPKDLAYRFEASNARAVIALPSVAERVDAMADRFPDQRFPNLVAKLVVNGTRPGWTDYLAAVDGASDTFDTVDTAANEPSICYFTSGTTKNPKMVLHDHASYAIGHEVTGRYWLDQRPGDLHWNISDSGWGKAAWSSYFGPFRCGSTVFADLRDAFDPVHTLALLQRFPITTFCAPPTVYRMLVQQDLENYDLSGLRHCVSAGEPLNPEVIARWKTGTGLTICDGYGQSETVLVCATFPGMEVRPGSMGKPCPGVDLNIVDENGEIAPDDVEGDIAVRVKPVRPVGLMIEYWNDPEKTAESMRGNWYITGDRARRDADGYFWFSGRADDVITSAGYRIGPFEVESALLEHTAVAESAVVSSPDEMRGSVVKAFVVLATGFEASDVLVEQLQEHVKKATAPYKYPRRIEFLHELPKNVSGKIRRVELRNREWGR
jgi:acetyl-CoA synthetase/medium-chain acyl-CoA synthetase